MCAQHRNVHSAVKKGSLQGSAQTPCSLPSLCPSHSLCLSVFLFHAPYLHRFYPSFFSFKTLCHPPLFFMHLLSEANCYAPCVLRWYIPMCRCFICPLSENVTCSSFVILLRAQRLSTMEGELEVRLRGAHANTHMLTKGGLICT